MARSLSVSVWVVWAVLLTDWVGCAARGARELGPGPSASRSPAPASNILRADYAGSDACAACHPAVFAAWQRSPMHNMTRLPAAAEVRAPFDGTEFHFKDDSVRLDRRGAERFMQVRSPRFGDHLYRVTKIIGGRYREDFAGVEVSAEAPAGEPRAELIMPVSYVFETHSFRVKGYSVMVTERPGLRAGGVWNQTCVLCHNTAPLFDSLWGALYGPGAPAYQGEVVDRALPRARRWSLAVTDAPGLTAALREEIEWLAGAPPVSSASADGAHPLPGGSEANPPAPRRLLAEAARTLRSHLVPSKLVEVGIGCEACHGGSREHVRRNDVLPSFLPRASFLEPRPPAAEAPVSPALAINRACARCHQVLFSRYPYTWEGGQRHPDPGGSHITSGEARDFLLGGCARQMSCVRCHDPHGAGDVHKLEALATPSGNGVCADCHRTYATPAALRAHAHHDPAGAGGSCVACHMPRKNLGLGYHLTRYHRIGSPTDRERVEGDRPLECALCHPRATVGELVTTMESWWGKRYDRGRLLGLYGDLAAQVLPATVARGKPHEQATAIAALGEARLASATRPLAAALAHPYPLVRYHARHALETILGSAVPVDLEQDAADIRIAVARWLDPAAPAPPLSPRPAKRSAVPVEEDED